MKKKNNVLEFASRDAISDPLTVLLRSGAQQLINQAAEAELQELLSQYSDRRPENIGSSGSSKPSDKIFTILPNLPHYCC